MEEGSIRSLGKTNINVDKVLRDDIRQQAQKQGVTMVEYLRAKVDEDKASDPQSVLLSHTVPATKADVKSLSDKVNALMSYVFSGKLDDDVFNTVIPALLGVKKGDITITPSTHLIEPDSKLGMLSESSKKALKKTLQEAIDRLDESGDTQSQLNLQDS